MHMFFSPEFKKLRDQYFCKKEPCIFIPHCNSEKEAVYNTPTALKSHCKKADGLGHTMLLKYLNNLCPDQEKRLKNKSKR